MNTGAHLSPCFQSFGVYTLRDGIPCCSGASPMAERGKNLRAMQETQETRVRSLGREDPLEKETETPSRILAWRIPWTEEPGRLQSAGSQSRTRLSTHPHVVVLCFVF